MNHFFKLGTMLTIVAGAAMTISSCSSNEIEPMSASDLALAKYEQAFIERFGQPAPNQTWGFGNVTKALTRAANPNNNQWFDPNQMNLEKPADITEAEKKHVMEWFATHTKADETTFDFKNYFVQQVDYSNNEYKTNNKDGSEVTISSYNHMDQIFANMNAEGTASDHVNNFNAGSGSIMLMENSETQYGFGYEESFGTDDKHVANNYLMAEIEVPGVGTGYYVGLNYQAKKNGEGINLEPDGKYDDRVLKIVPAQLKADVRVIAEDLSVNENSDFDFNDVVFDVKFGYPQWDKTTIILQAAGGTLPLYVGGQEVHEKFGVSTSTMVNTGDGISKAPVSFVLDSRFDGNANGILVEVEKDGVKIPITAQRGKVASKIAVGTDYVWCLERQDIVKKHPNFGKYVTGEVEDIWW